MSLEQDLKQKRKRVRIQEILLLTLYGTAALTMAVAAPNALRVLKYFDPQIGKKRNAAHRIQQAFRRLESRGLVARNAATNRFELTKNGERYTRRLKEKDSLMPQRQQKRKWDGRWRIIVFDIWERRRGVRDQLRRTLVRIGFKRIQNSVWAYPFECEELLALLRLDFRLGRSILYIVAEGIENDAELRAHFGLKPQ